MATTRLSALSSQTLSLVLERQRLETLGKAPPVSQLANVKRNLELLRQGILSLERSDEAEQVADKIQALRNQWERARRMLGKDAEGIEDLPVLEAAPSPSLETDSLSVPLMSVSGGDPVDTPYRDDEDGTPLVPSSRPFEPDTELQMQRQMMEEQDTHLDTLSQSIRRQRDISLNIGSELDSHTELLEDLEGGIDRTARNLGGARRRLDRVARGAKDNCSAVTIGTLIVVLLILIVIFKT